MSRQEIEREIERKKQELDSAVQKLAKADAACGHVQMKTMTFIKKDIPVREINPEQWESIGEVQSMCQQKQRNDGNEPAINAAK